MLGLAVVPTKAATLEVTQTADPDPTPGVAPYNLREAFAAANSGDTIVITGTDPSYEIGSTIDLAGKTIRLDTRGKTITVDRAVRAFNIPSGNLDIFNGGKISVTGTTGQVTGNGGLFLNNGTLTINGVTLENATVSGNGGAIYTNGAITVVNSTISGNSATDGGGIYMDTNASGTISDVTLSGNTLTGTDTSIGAGAVLRAATLEGVTVSGNSRAQRGGGLYIYGRVTLKDMKISSNTAQASVTNPISAGGGIYVAAGGEAKLTSSSMTGNSADHGAAIYNVNNIDIVNSTIYNNTANASGGAVYNESGVTTLSFVTLDENLPSGLRRIAGSVYIRNTILANDSNNNCAGTIIDDGGNIEFAMGSCTFTKTDSVAGDPNLAALASGYYPLNSGSLAINTVDSCTVSSFSQNFSPYSPGNVVTNDQRGAPRPYGTKCDKGAFESTEPIASAAGLKITVSEPIVYEEGETSFQYGLSLTTAPESDITINLTEVAVNPAIGTGHITFSPSSVTFTPLNWPQPQTITVTAIDDSRADEGDPHSVDIAHTASSAPAPYTGLAFPPLNVTVRDNENSIVVSAGPDVAVNEGNSATTTMTFTIELSQAVTAGSVSVSYRTVDTTATSPADYELVTGLATFDSTTGTSQNVNVFAVGDTVGEPNEIFYFEIASVTNALLGTRTRSLGTIQNDDDINAITINPETLPFGRTGSPYSAQITASGGSGSYTFLLSGTLPEGINFDAGTGIISGTSANDTTATFTINVSDDAGLTGTRTYTLTFNATGADPNADPATAPTATPLSPAEVEATRVASIRATLGDPYVMIDPDTEIGGVSVRTGPMVGATQFNALRRDKEYRVLGQHRIQGSGVTWYLVEYESDPFAQTPDETSIEITTEGETVEVVEMEQGWVSGRFLVLGGATFDIPTLSNPFDSVNMGDTGITGQVALKNNIYRYPTPSSMLVAQFDEGSTFQILARTNIDQRDLTYWILVRLDQTGQVGWMRYVPEYMSINGNLSTLPTY